ncbi:hypothetical protein PT300_11795 [Enterobacteriaceae bacterium ESL0689]|nr:hypothetical protein [Enterobacteriaceae bacterium ESL0689]
MTQPHNTQTVIRGCVRPGMLIKHDGKTYRASANKNGKLYLFNLTETKRITDVFVEVCINSHGEPVIN